MTSEKCQQHFLTCNHWYVHKEILKKKKPYSKVPHHFEDFLVVGAK